MWSFVGRGSQRSPASSWPGLAASAERAARADCARIDTEHLLLTLLDPPQVGDEDSSSAQPLSAPSLLRRAGLSQTVVLVVVEAVYGPGAATPVAPKRGRTLRPCPHRARRRRGDRRPARADSTPTDDDVLVALVSAPGWCGRSGPRGAQPEPLAPRIRAPAVPSLTARARWWFRLASALPARSQADAAWAEPGRSILAPRGRSGPSSALRSDHRRTTSVMLAGGRPGTAPRPAPTRSRSGPARRTRAEDVVQCPDTAEVEEASTWEKSVAQTSRFHGDRDGAARRGAAAVRAGHRLPRRGHAPRRRPPPGAGWVLVASTVLSAAALAGLRDVADLVSTVCLPAVFAVIGGRELGPIEGTAGELEFRSA